MAGRKIALVPLFFFFLSLTFFSRDEEKWMESLLSTWYSDIFSKELRDYHSLKLKRKMYRSCETSFERRRVKSRRACHFTQK